MDFKRYIKRIRLHHIIKKNSKFIQYGKDVLFEDTFRLRLDNPLKDKTYVKVGNSCILGGNIIFESAEGCLTIGDRTQLSGGCTIICRTDTVIGNDVIIAGGTTLYNHDSHSIFWSQRKDDVCQQLKDVALGNHPLKTKNWEHVKAASIVIGDKAWIGRDVLILKGVKIGEGAVIGAGSVVTHDVGDYMLAAGNPAREIRSIKEDNG